MNADSIILSLIVEKQNEVVALRNENAQLRAALEELSQQTTDE